ncbi:MAG: 3-deoxy-manno-octulosonate cytidylyltransferase [Rikenellaceae bacterium]|nr:3-deoxy-manno-octulosonate cytidylyltransferase [Rikenellaceae bacterium]
MKDSILIVIPARYASKRLPGKPLVKIAGKEMIGRVAEIAEYVCAKNSGCSYAVATDNDRIAEFCGENGIPVLMTSGTCRSGTERCLDAVRQTKHKPEFIINLQGDNPLCPPWFLEQMIAEWRADKEAQVFTPFLHLSWEEYDRLKESKRETPFSGTTVLVDKSNYALAFSKNIIPALRREQSLRVSMDKPPVRRHIGLYGYTYEALENYFRLEPSSYEEAEGLEQMRFLYHRIPVKLIEVDYRGRRSSSGVDSPEDVQRVESIIAEFGEFDLSL